MLHVVFLAAAPAAGRAAALDPARSPPDELTLVGREVFLRCPNGMARTRITNAWLDATLATTSTVRNWRTVEKLAGDGGGVTGLGPSVLTLTAFSGTLGPEPDGPRRPSCIVWTHPVGRGGARDG